MRTRRVGHAMYDVAVATVGHVVHHLAHVDDERALPDGHVTPHRRGVGSVGATVDALAALCVDQHLQPAVVLVLRRRRSGVGACDKREEHTVPVRLDAHRAVGGRGALRWVVRDRHGPEGCTTCTCGEVVSVEAERDGEERVHPLCEALHCAIVRRHRLAQSRHLLGPRLLRRVRALGCVELTPLVGCVVRRVVLVERHAAVLDVQPLVDDVSVRRLLLYLVCKAARRGDGAV